MSDAVLLQNSFDNTQRQELAIYQLNKYLLTSSEIGEILYYCDYSLDLIKRKELTSSLNPLLKECIYLLDNPDDAVITTCPSFILSLIKEKLYFSDQDVYKLKDKLKNTSNFVDSFYILDVLCYLKDKDVKKLLSDLLTNQCKNDFDRFLFVSFITNHSLFEDFNYKNYEVKYVN